MNIVLPEASDVTILPTDKSMFASDIGVSRVASPTPKFCTFSMMFVFKKPMPVAAAATPTSASTIIGCISFCLALNIKRLEKQCIQLANKIDLF